MFPESAYIDTGALVWAQLRVLRACLPAAALEVKVAIICGSGLSGLADALVGATAVPYTSLPGFPVPSVAGHGAELVFGELAGVRVVAQRGRFHSYEGHSPRVTVAPVRMFAALGARVLLVTNAAGGLNSAYRVGDIMLLRDHLSLPSLTCANALAGPNDERFGPRFASMTTAYLPALRSVAAEAAAAAGLGDAMREGVYAHVSGPAYETPAEVSALRTLGADAVGMSTAPEVIAASHAGLAVLGLSLITNACRASGDTGAPPTHEEVLAATAARAADLQTLVADIVGRLPLETLRKPCAAAHFAVANANESDETERAATAAATAKTIASTAEGARALHAHLHGGLVGGGHLISLFAVGVAGGIVGAVIALAVVTVTLSHSGLKRRTG